MNKKDYPLASMDEISQWLFDNFGLLPGCCSSIKELEYSVARMVAEALWPPKEGYIRKDTLFEFLDFMKDYHSGVYISADVLNAIERLKEKINSL